MKKPVFVFVALFVLMFTTGCGNRSNTIRFDNQAESQETESNEKNENTEISETTNQASVQESELSVDNLNHMEAVTSKKLDITSLTDSNLKTNLSYHVIRGVAGPETSSIKVNGYQLRKFKPNQTQWNYIASTGFETLKEGLNEYKVQAFNAKGEETDSVMFSIDYKPMKTNELPWVGLNHWFTLLISVMASLAWTFFNRRWNRKKISI